MKTGVYNVSHERQTRNQDDLQPKNHWLTKTRQSIMYIGPILFNSLPEEIRNAPRLSNFKTKLKSHFIGQYN